MRSYNLTIAILAVAIAVVGAALVISSMSGSGEDLKEGEFPIEYHLNGGSLLDDAIDRYAQGTYTELPSPEKERKYFSGWYTDRDCTNPIGAVLPTQTGALTLYAGWIDEIVGEYFTLSFRSDMSLSSGTMTFRFMAVDSEGNHYVERITKQGRETNTTGYWNDEAGSGSDYKYRGNMALEFEGKDYNCEIWQNQNGEVQYIYHSYLVLRITATQGFSKLTFTLKEYGQFTPETEMDIGVVADVGSNVTGSLTTHIGDKVELNATGDFHGWYQNGELISEERKLIIPRATPGSVYEIRSTEGYTEMETLTVNSEELGLEGRVLITSTSGAQESHGSGDIEFLKPGYYTITDSSSPVTKQVRLHLTLNYKITYILNGGTLPEDSPTSYSYGEYADLPLPTYGDRFFEGWYTDAECKDPIGAILATTKGDITVYASWTDNVVGKGFVMDFRYVSSTYFYTTVTTGVISWKYLSEDSEGNYYVLVNSRVDGGQEKVRGYWTGEPSDDPFYYQGNETLTWNGKTYNCEVWQNSSGETQWIYRSFLPIKIVSYVSGGSITYILSEQVSFDPSTLGSITIVADKGITVTGAEDVAIGEKVELTAAGDSFQGWYIDGTLSTKDRTLTVDRITPGVSYEARSSYDYMILESKTVDVRSLGLEGDVTAIYEEEDSRTYTSGIITLEQPGYVVLMDSSKPVSNEVRLFIDTEKTFSTTWKYGNKTYSYTTSIKYSDVFRYSLNDQYSSRDIYEKPEYVDRFFTVDDTYVKSIADYLSAYRTSENMSDPEFATFVMRFVESIAYLDDLKTRGANEFFKYPAEYLWDNGGDCEDSSIMYATLMYALGYDSGILLFNDHAMAMVYVGDDVSKYKNVYNIDEKPYVFVETTDAYYDQKDGGYQLGDSYGSGYTATKVRYAYRVADAF